MNNKHTFKLSDESLNHYGFWILTKGLVLDSFRENPVMLYDHESLGVLPIGRWTNIRVEDKVLMADAEFDMEDEFAFKIANKVENGFLKGCSIRFNIIETSEDKKFVKQGQIRPTVVKAEVTEASITALPGNKNALKLSYAGKHVELNRNTADIEINKILKPIEKMNTNKIKTMLNLSADATSVQVEKALQEILAEKTALLAKETESKSVIEKLKADRFKSLEIIGELSGGFKDADLEKIQKLADFDFELALSFVYKKEEGKKTTSELRISEIINALNSSGKNEPKPQVDFSNMTYGEKIAFKLSQKHKKQSTDN